MSLLCQHVKWPLPRLEDFSSRKGQIGAQRISLGTDPSLEHRPQTVPPLLRVPESERQNEYSRSKQSINPHKTQWNILVILYCNKFLRTGTAKKILLIVTENLETHKLQLGKFQVPVLEFARISNFSMWKTILWIIKVGIRKTQQGVYIHSSVFKLRKKN